VVLNYVKLRNGVIPKLEGSDCDEFLGFILAFTLNDERKSRRELTS
jgi:hypothetical protein